MRGYLSRKFGFSKEDGGFEGKRTEPKIYEPGFEVESQHPHLPAALRQAASPVK